MDIRKIYEYALQREREGKQFFEQNAERLNHAAAVGAFKRLATEEQRHIEFIQAQINALDKGEKPDTEGEEREVLQMLANWERDHERFFKQLHDQAFEEYAQMPWGD